ncbi:hypothetical protein SynBIOSU31_00594 [Synechococcus sp. BIOS-U3-1]|nr:hypothetical protein SynBIOSU31_00594 [Synechococcus sp. BIOS-U3-1]
MLDCLAIWRRRRDLLHPYRFLLLEQHSLHVYIAAKACLLGGINLPLPLMRCDRCCLFFQAVRRCWVRDLSPSLSLSLS